MTRWLLVLLMAVSWLGWQLASAGATAGSGIVISGGDLPQSVRLAPSDEDAFMRRINTPPRLDERPERASGRTYTLTTSYWQTILARPGRAPVEGAATYFVEGGIVRVVQDGQDIWLALDLRQQAILDRYIGLAKAGAVPSRPGLLDVLGATVREENVTLEAAGGSLSAGQVGSLWGAFASTGAPQFLDPPQPPKGRGEGFWLVFGLEEGRSLQLFYQPGGPGWLTDVLGEERYIVSSELAAALSSVKANTHPIDDKSKPGSRSWWLVMLGAGVICLAAAAWLLRHPLRLPFEPKA